MLTIIVIITFVFIFIIIAISVILSIIFFDIIKKTIIFNTNNVFIIKNGRPQIH